MLDASTLKASETVKLGGEAAEAGVTDGKGTIFVNLEDLNEIITFDAKSLGIKERYKIGTGEESMGLAIDLKTERLFTVCGNKKMIILDAKDGKVIAEIGISGRCDGVAYDPSSKTAFSSNGESTITAVNEDSPNKYSITETIKSAIGARTIAYDEKTHHVFSISTQYGETPPVTTENPRPRAKIIPNTFMIMEFGK